MKKKQRQKGMGNRDLWDAMQEIRRSSAAEPHRNKARYKRPKAGARRREW